MPSAQAGRIPEWSVSDRLRKARESAGLDQTDLAALTGVSRTSISAAENGKTAPRAATLRLWAMATGVPLGWLQTGKMCTPRDLNSEPTDYEKGAEGSVTDISAARSLRVRHEDPKDVA